MIDVELGQSDTLNADGVAFHECLPHRVVGEHFQGFGLCQLDLGQAVKRHKVEQVQPEALLHDFFLFTIRREEWDGYVSESQGLVVNFLQLVLEFRYVLGWD